MRKCRESPDRDAARDRRKRLAVNAKCEVDREVSMSALKVKEQKGKNFMRFLNELHEGDRVNGIYLCKQKQAATTKNGKPYENLILQDKTGVIDGKIWDPNSLGIDDFDALDYIEIMGDVTSFAGAMQLNIKRARKAGEGEYDPADYLPTSENSVDDMQSQLRDLINSVKNPYLSQLLKKL